jgi:hypothetical protein
LSFLVPRAKAGACTISQISCEECKVGGTLANYVCCGSYCYWAVYGCGTCKP